MPTPLERLNARKALMECRVCAFLATLTEKERKDWQAAIANTRFGGSMIAAEMVLEAKTREYTGLLPGESSVQTHRMRGH